MLLDIIIMHKKRKGIIIKDLMGLEEILNRNKSIKYKRIIWEAYSPQEMSKLLLHPMVI